MVTLGIAPGKKNTRNLNIDHFEDDFPLQASGFQVLCQSSRAYHYVSMDFMVIRTQGHAAMPSRIHDDSRGCTPAVSSYDFMEPDPVGGVRDAGGSA